VTTDNYATDPPARVHQMQIVPFEIQHGSTSTGRVCDHVLSGFTVWEKDRTIVCKGCGSQVDPFFAIAQFARDYERWAERKKYARAQCEAAEQRIETLRRKEREAQKRLDAVERTERIAAEIAGKKPVFGIDSAKRGRAEGGS
jgi:hypothetical protein